MIAKMRFLLLIALGFSILGSDRLCHASFVYSFNENGTNQDFSVNVGGQISIPIYLVQIGGEDRLSTIGMFSAGATVSYSYSMPQTSFTEPDNAALASHWTDTFSNFATIDFPNQQVVLEGLVDDVGSPVRATNNAILLGNVTFTASSVANTLSLTLSLDGNNLLANTFVDPLETFGDTGLAFKTASIHSITAVPEPTSLIFATVLASGGIVATRRKRKRMATEEAA